MTPTARRRTTWESREGLVSTPDLFDAPAARPYGGEPPSQRHSDTSQAAATAIKAKVGPLQRRVLDYLLAHPAGATDEQLMDALHLDGNTLRPRRRELQLMGSLQDSTHRDTTRSGRAAVMWVAV